MSGKDFTIVKKDVVLKYLNFIRGYQDRFIAIVKENSSDKYYFVYAKTEESFLTIQDGGQFPITQTHINHEDELDFQVTYENSTIYFRGKTNQQTQDWVEYLHQLIQDQLEKELTSVEFVEFDTPTPNQHLNFEVKVEGDIVLISCIITKLPSSQDVHDDFHDSPEVLDTKLNVQQLQKALIDAVVLGGQAIIESDNLKLQINNLKTIEDDDTFCQAVLDILNQVIPYVQSGILLEQFFNIEVVVSDLIESLDDHNSRETQRKVVEVLSQHRTHIQDFDMNTDNETDVRNFISRENDILTHLYEVMGQHFEFQARPFDIEQRIAEENLSQLLNMNEHQMDKDEFVSHQIHHEFALDVMSEDQRADAEQWRQAHLSGNKSILQLRIQSLTTYQDVVHQCQERVKASLEQLELDPSLISVWKVHQADLEFRHHRVSREIAKWQDNLGEIYVNTVRRGWNYVKAVYENALTNLSTSREEQQELKLEMESLDEIVLEKETSKVKIKMNYAQTSLKLFKARANNFALNPTQRKKAESRARKFEQQITSLRSQLVRIKDDLENDIQRREKLEADYLNKTKIRAKKQQKQQKSQSSTGQKVAQQRLKEFQNKQQEQLSDDHSKHDMSEDEIRASRQAAIQRIKKYTFSDMPAPIPAVDEEEREKEKADLEAHRELTKQRIKEYSRKEVHRKRVYDQQKHKQRTKDLQRRKQQVEDAEKAALNKDETNVKFLYLNDERRRAPRARKLDEKEELEIEIENETNKTLKSRVIKRTKAPSKQNAESSLEDLPPPPDNDLPPPPDSDLPPPPDNDLPPPPDNDLPPPPDNDLPPPPDNDLPPPPDNDLPPPPDNNLPPPPDNNLPPAQQQSQAGAPPPPPPPPPLPDLDNDDVLESSDSGRRSGITPSLLTSIQLKKPTRQLSGDQPPKSGSIMDSVKARIGKMSTAMRSDSEDQDNCDDDDDDDDDWM